MTARVLLLVEQRQWLAAAALPPLLRDAGLVVDVICRPKNLITHSRFIDRCVQVEGPEHDYFDAVRQHLGASAEPYAWVLPVTDTDVRGLAHRLDEPWAAGIFPAARTPAVIAALLDKSAMDAHLARSGVSVPPSMDISSVDDLLAFAGDTGWPVMLKPSDGVGGGGVVRVENAEQARVAVNAARISYPVLSAQAFIPGTPAYCQVVYAHGVPLEWMTSYKVRTWPGPYGPATIIRIAPIPGVEREVEMLGQALDFHGVLSFDMIVDSRSGRPTVIEVNARPAGVMTRGALAGVDFGSALRRFVRGEGPSTLTHGTRHTRRRRLFPQELLRCIEERDLLSAAACLHPGALADMPWSDPAVLWFSIRYLLARLRKSR
jgi:predicted ATP-grasp superfamily ATP-dependent carboligase